MGIEAAFELVRPIADVRYDCGTDGRDGGYYIEYKCPGCGKVIGYTYKSETACNKCGTFYDWGKKEPVIKVTRTVEWR